MMSGSLQMRCHVRDLIVCKLQIAGMTIPSDFVLGDLVSPAIDGNVSLCFSGDLFLRHPDLIMLEFIRWQ